MEVFSCYSVRITESHKAFEDTVALFRSAVDFFIPVILEHWGTVFNTGMGMKCQEPAERLCCATIKRPCTQYDFAQKFPRFPIYLRRAAIRCAYGKVSSYISLFTAWEQNPKGNPPGKPNAGREFPSLYRGNMFVRSGLYCARIKVYFQNQNTWDWMEVQLRKGDVDYISRHCKEQTERVPTLCRRGKVWSLDFPFSKVVQLTTRNIFEQIVVGVDIGFNNACVCVVMLSDGTIAGQYFLDLPAEKDSLDHALGHLRRAQKHGSMKAPRKWASVKGVNDDMAVKTAQYIIGVAVKHDADVIVMEYLDFNGKKLRGTKYRQKLHLWKARHVQHLVEHKAHMCGKRFSRVCAWNTSRLAFDGSGAVERDKDNYSLCTFQTGKYYHCDLSAAKNIAARYFIREILKTLPERERQRILANVPECVHRTTCTLSSLIRMRAELGEEPSGKSPGLDGQTVLSASRMEPRQSSL